MTWISFTGPSADVLMLVLSPPGQPLKFDLGLVPGVFVGAFLSALLWRELKLEGFQGGQAMKRYIAGAINFIGDTRLYGRNWGCLEDHPFLHFEVCYHQAIEFAF